MSDELDRKLEQALGELAPGEQAALLLYMLDSYPEAFADVADLATELALKVGGDDPSAFREMADFIREYKDNLPLGLLPVPQEPLEQLSLFPEPGELLPGEPGIVPFFEEFDERVRRVPLDGEVWFSVVDVIAVVTDSDRPRKYWSDMKRREPDVSEFCGRIPMTDATGNRSQETDAATREGLFRILQSVPSPKVEPFKRWLAYLGERRAQEIENPLLEADHAREQLTAAERRMDRINRTAERMGYGEEWITRRLEEMDPQKLLMAELQHKAGNRGHQFMYVHAHEAIFRGWKQVGAKEIRGLLEIPRRDAIRDHLHPLALEQIKLIEMASLQLLSDLPDDQPQPPSYMVEIIRSAAETVGYGTRALEKLLGFDLLTGGPLDGPEAA